MRVGYHRVSHWAFVLSLTACLSTSHADAQSPAPILTVRADPQAKTYGAPDPLFTFTYQGFTNGDTVSAVSGQPVVTVPQRVQNLWQYSESLPAWWFAYWQFAADGATQQSNGIQLLHVASAGNFYSQISASLAAFQSPIVYPGMQYLLSFYAFSNVNSNQVYWHRSLADGTVPGWGPTVIGPNVQRIVFRCAGTVDGALDCGSNATVPLGVGPDQASVYWLFLGQNGQLSGADPSAASFQQSVPADLYIGGFQMEPAITEKRGVLAMGDSLTQYDCSTDDGLSCTSWTAFAASQLDVPFFNRGIYSQTCEQIQARWPTDASPILTANAKYVIIFCGTNDITSGFSVEQIEQSIAAMTSLAVVDGATPVVATVGPFRTTVPNSEATRQTINAWIRTTYPLVLDFDKVNADPANPTEQNPAYVDDGIHLNILGRVAEGTYVAQSIAGNANGYPEIWSFQAPIPYQPVLGMNPSNGMDFHLGVQREAGSYIILPAAGTLSSNKYSFAFSSAPLTVAPAPLSVSTNNKSMTYGTALPVLDGSLTGALTADNISASYSSNATSTSGPGTYVITPALIDPGNRLPNYTVTQSLGTLTINPATCAAPTFSVVSGTYPLPIRVSILDNTPGAVVHYTTDGTTPTTASPVYTSPFAVPNSETVQAVAVALPDYAASPVATSQYTIVPTISDISPAFTSAGGSGFTLTVSGTGFGPTSVVHFGSVSLLTQLVSPNALSALVPSTALANSGLNSVVVQETANSSNALQFEIDSSDASAYAPAFNPSSANIAAGGSATFAVTLPAAATNVSISCLNLPANATCSYATGAMTMATSSATPSGSFLVVIVVTETVPLAASAWLLFPLGFLPFMKSGKKSRSKPVGLALLSLFLALLATFGGCGGSSPAPLRTTQVTSSGTVLLNIH